eukprot:5744966-Pleurochrysis_carterae.AAC.1
MFNRGTVSPVWSVRDALPVVACTRSATCASVASLPRLTRRSITTAPLSVRSGRSTSQRYLGR